MANRVIFVLGGARSGKSHFAQELAKELGARVLFIATGEPLDEEMKVRIEEHKKSRPDTWQTLEIPTNIGIRMMKEAEDADVIIIDCLSLLVCNCTGDELDHQKAEEKIKVELNVLVSCINRLDSSFIIVSNEVGMSLVPDNKLGRLYRDLLGKANQHIAKHSDEVYFLVAGIPLKIKGTKHQYNLAGDIDD